MKRFTPLVVSLLRLLAVVLAFPAASLIARETNLAKISSTVAQVFAEGHYAHPLVDEAFSRKCLTAYLEKIDPDHLFFTLQDIAEINQNHASRFGQQTCDGNLSPAIAIFDRLKTRIRERRVKIEELLKNTKFEFNSERFVEISREHAQWPKDEQEADALWLAQIEGDLLDAKLEGEELAASQRKIQERYERIESEALQHSRSDVMADLLSSLAHAYDPHSDYLRKQDFEALNADMRLSMVGIGISIEPDGRFMKITDVYPSSPAGVDGRLKPNDRILAVAHGDSGFVKIEGMSFERVMDLLRARKGSRLQLKVVELGGAASPRVVDLVARTIELTDDQAQAEIIERQIDSQEAGSADPKAVTRLGWLKIPSFYGDPSRSDGKSVARDVRQLLKILQAKKIDGLVLDMRGNPGGELDEAVKIGGLFLGKAPIVQEKDDAGSIYLAKATSPAVYTGPMVVLIDHLTASAAELLAAALQDHGRAIIAGGRYSSFGKGTVQTVLELKDLMANVPRSDSFGAIQLTIAKFYRVNGASTQLKGITADILLPSPEDLPGEGEQSMKNPLPYDEVPPVSGVLKLDPSALPIAELRERSEARVKSNREFQFLLEDLALAKKNANKVSLNESVRRQERAEEKNRTEARTAERAQMPASNERIIPVPLKERRERTARSNSKSKTGPDVVRFEALNILTDYTHLSKRATL